MTDGHIMPFIFIGVYLLYRTESSVLENGKLRKSYQPRLTLKAMSPMEHSAREGHSSSGDEYEEATTFDLKHILTFSEHSLGFKFYVMMVGMSY